jgi:hypothetical protein
MPYGAGIVEVNETNPDGINYSISVELVDDEYNNQTFLIINKLGIAGKVLDSGYPRVETLSNNASIYSIAYNNVTNTVALFGSSGDGDSVPLIIKLSLNDGTASGMVIDTMVFDSIEGLVPNYNELTSGVIQDDNSIIALGTGKVGENPNPTTYLIKVTADGLIDNTFDNLSTDEADDDVLSVNIPSDNTLASGKIFQLSDSSLVYAAIDSDEIQSYLVKLVDVDPTTGLDAQKYKLDNSFASAAEGEADGVITLNMSALTQFNNGPKVRARDIIVDSNNNIIVVGYAMFYMGKKAGFIAKFNGLTGAPDTTLGTNSLPGYYIPNGRNGCSYLKDPQLNPPTSEVESKLCDLYEFEKVSVLDDGSLIIHSLLQSAPENTINSVILKFIDQQDDHASSYSIFNGSPP